MPDSGSAPLLPRVLAVAGPTASGKTAAAVALALRIGGEVVSADSMLVYRGMDIGTAKPAPVERRGVPHHLIDVADPGDSFSVADYARLARIAIRGILARGRVPIVCGGTGQYLSALADGLSFLSAAPDPAVRAHLLEEAGRLGNDALLARLAAADPETAARLHANDRKRIVRALEVLETTGRTVADLNRDSRSEPPDFAVRIAALSPDREVLYRRCDARVDRMIALGLREEVAGLIGRGVPLSSQAMQAIGYKEMAAHLAGACSLDEAADRIRQATRRYAKRQLTWLRGMEDVRWVPIADDEPSGRVAERILGVFPEFLT